VRVTARCEKRFGIDCGVPTYCVSRQQVIAPHGPKGLARGRWTSDASLCPDVPCAPARDLGVPLSSFARHGSTTTIFSFKSVVTHAGTFLLCAVVETPLYQVCSCYSDRLWVSLGACCRSSLSCHWKMPVCRSQTVASYDCRPWPSAAAQPAGHGGRGSQQCVGGWAPPLDGSPAALKPSQEPLSMHFGTARSALDRLERDNRLRARAGFGCGPPTGLGVAQHPSARSFTGEGTRLSYPLANVEWL
jgi:hypothetical protein